MRITRAADGALRIGRTDPGRGAWVCGADCLDRAIRRRAVDRALRATVGAAELAAVRAKLLG